MKKITKAAPWVIAAIALAFIIKQQVDIGALTDRIDGLPKVAPAATPAPEAAPPQSVPVEVSDSSDVLEKRLKALDRRVTMAMSRIAALGKERRRPATKTDAALPSVLSDEVAALREDVDALLTGGGLDSREARDKVKTLIDKTREKARAERRERRNEFRSARREEWLTEFSSSAGLDGEQQEAVKTIMARQDEVRQKLRETVRNGDKSFSEMREAMRVARKATEDELREVLDEEQFAAYQKNRAERRERRGPR